MTQGDISGESDMHIEYSENEKFHFFVQYCGKFTEENDHFMGNNISNAKGGQDIFRICTSEKLVILKNKVNLRNISHMSDLGGWCVNRNKQMLSGVT